MSFYTVFSQIHLLLATRDFVIMMVAVSEMYVEFLDACSVNINWAIFFFLDTLQVTSVLKVFVFISNSSLGNKFPGHFFFSKQLDWCPSPQVAEMF